MYVSATLFFTFLADDSKAEASTSWVDEDTDLSKEDNQEDDGAGLGVNV